jgi:hypothetical protein
MAQFVTAAHTVPNGDPLYVGINVGGIFELK